METIPYVGGIAVASHLAGLILTPNRFRDARRASDKAAQLTVYQPRLDLLGFLRPRFPASKGHMPYGKYNRFQRTSSIRRSVKKRTYPVRRGATSAARTGCTRVVGYYRGSAASRAKELKFFDAIIDTTPITVALIVRKVTTITQGTGESQRVGRAIFLRSLHWKGSIVLVPNATAAALSEVYKLFVVVDTQTNGAILTAAELWELDGAHQDIWSFNNLVNQQRFKVLWSRTFAINAQTFTASLSGEMAVPFAVNLKLGDLKIEYSGTDGLNAEIKSNNIYVCYIQQSGSSNSSIISRSRVRFTD